MADKNVPNSIAVFSVSAQRAYNELTERFGAQRDVTGIGIAQSSGPDAPIDFENVHIRITLRNHRAAVGKDIPDHLYGCKIVKDVVVYKSGVLERPVSEAGVSDAPVRPLRGGLSCSSCEVYGNITYNGTLGAIAHDAMGRHYAVSCCHVFTPKSTWVPAPNGTRITDPGLGFGGTCPTTSVASLTWSRLDSSNDVSTGADLAIAEIDQNIPVDANVGDPIPGHGGVGLCVGSTWPDMDPSWDNKWCYSFGHTTGNSHGWYKETGWRDVDYDALGKTIRLLNVYTLHRDDGPDGHAISLPGDSGAAWVHNAACLGINAAGPEDGSEAVLTPSVMLQAIAKQWLGRDVQFGV